MWEGVEECRVGGRGGVCVGGSGGVSWEGGEGCVWCRREGGIGAKVSVWCGVDAEHTVSYAHISILLHAHRL